MIFSSYSKSTYKFRFAFLGAMVSFLLPVVLSAQDYTSACKADIKYGSIPEYLEHSHNREQLSSYVQPNVSEEQPYELHIIASFEGVREVIVRQSSLPLVLVLVSYRSSSWKITLEEGANLKHVYLSGRGSQEIEGDHSISYTRCNYPLGYEWKSKDWKESLVTDRHKDFVDSVRDLTGLMESSYQAANNFIEEAIVPFPKEQYSKYPVEKQRKRYSSQLSKLEALSIYRKEIQSMPKSFKPLFELLIQMMEEDKLPYLIVDDRPFRTRPRYLKMLKIKPWKRVETKLSGKLLNCTRGGSKSIEDPVQLFEGTDKRDYISCSNGSHAYLLKGGEDIVDDASGDDIVDGGRGNDTLDMGAGTDILVFNKNWGRDIVSKGCNYVDPNDFEPTKHIPTWPYKFVNFVVFGKGIHPEKLKWKNNKLVYEDSETDSSNSIVFHSDNPCFNFIFYEEGVFNPH